MRTHITERGRSLSGGQRQRLALARSLVTDPEVLVLDEPTSAVDAHTEARIADGLREIRTGRTTVVLTSSPLLLDRADQVVFLQEGKVVAEATHRELLHSHPAYRAVVTRETDKRDPEAGRADLIDRPHLLPPARAARRTRSRRPHDRPGATGARSGRPADRSPPCPSAHRQPSAATSAA